MKHEKSGWRAIRWRRVIVLGLLSSLLSFLLSGCRPFEIMDGPGMEYHGGDNVPAEDPGPESIGDFDGTWLTWDGNAKLIIRGGEVDLYRKDGETGKYQHTGACKMVFDENGGRALRPEQGETTPGLLSYSVIEKKGVLLYATVPVMDAAADVDVFALEGHEEDLPPRPVYAKSAEDVADRHIRSLTLSAGCSHEDVTDGFLFHRLPGCEKAVSLVLMVTTSQLTGEKLVVGEVRGSSETEAAPLLEVDCPLTEALEERLAGLLLSPEVLEHNPYRDSGDMLCPTVSFTLEAEFASGEAISMKTSYGVLIGDTAVELAELLLNAAN